MSFWKKVCSELEYQGLSRKELAYKTNLQVATINRAIERDSQPYALDAFRIANALHVTPEYLLDLPKENSNNTITNLEINHQIEMYKKYHRMIEELEKMNTEQQIKAIEIITSFINFGK